MSPPLPLKPLSALVALLLVAPVVFQAQTVPMPTPPAASPATAQAKKESGNSEWVFSILPKSLQKDPRVEITVITEMMPAGKKLPPVSPVQPAYYELFSSGYRQLGEPTDEHTIKQGEIEKVLTRSLATNGYLRAQLPAQPPSLLIVYIWGSHNKLVEPNPEFPVLSPSEVNRNILDRAALIGGEKFAQRLLDLFERAGDLQDAASSLVPPGGEQIFTPEMMAFSNPIEMFRRETTRNEFLMDQTADDVYYVVASAYDYSSAAANRRTLLWRTRMTVAAPGVSQEQTLPTLVLSAAPYFGKDMAEAEIITKRAMREGTVELGTPVVVPSTEVDLRPAAKK